MENPKTPILGPLPAQQSSEARSWQEEKHSTCHCPDEKPGSCGRCASILETAEKILQQKRLVDGSRVGKFVRRAAPIALKLALGIACAQLGIKTFAASEGLGTEPANRRPNGPGPAESGLSAQESELFI